MSTFVEINGIMDDNKGHHLPALWHPTSDYGDIRRAVHRMQVKGDIKCNVGTYIKVTGMPTSGKLVAFQFPGHTFNSQPMTAELMMHVYKTAKCDSDPPSSPFNYAIYLSGFIAYFF